jgi:hypothetical protein
LCTYWECTVKLPRVSLTTEYPILYFEKLFTIFQEKYFQHEVTWCWAAVIMSVSLPTPLVLIYLFNK